MDDLSNAAIQAALTHNWEEAIIKNEAILEENSGDVETMCRLAYAYLQTGKTDKAKQFYHKVLALDHYNIIAQKNLDKIGLIPKSKKGAKPALTVNSISPNLFIEEPGKTKSVALTHTAPGSVLAQLDIGDPVNLLPKKHTVEIRNNDNVYLGALPDDISFRLLKYIKAGNSYTACVKDATKNSVVIFIRELKRGKRFFYQPSFPPTSSLLPHAHKEIRLSHHTDDDSEEVTPPSEDEE